MQPVNKDTKGSSARKKAKTSCWGPWGIGIVWLLNETSGLWSIVSTRPCCFMLSHHQNRWGQEVKKQTGEADETSEPHRNTEVNLRRREVAAADVEVRQKEAARLTQHWHFSVWDPFFSRWPRFCVDEICTCRQGDSKTPSNFTLL